jgi:flagellar motor switch protein FliG
MNQLIKAKVIIELLDDRKYSVLSSFTDSELNKLNNIDLNELNQLSSVEINGIISDFLKDVEANVALKTKEDPKADVKEEKKPAKKYDSKKKTKKVAVDHAALAIQKMQHQPPQLLACLIHQLDDEKKEFVLSNISNEKKTEVEAIQVEKTPISPEVISILKKELELV